MISGDLKLQSAGDDPAMVDLSGNDAVSSGLARHGQGSGNSSGGGGGRKASKKPRNRRGKRGRRKRNKKHNRNNRTPPPYFPPEVAAPVRGLVGTPDPLNQQAS